MPKYKTKKELTSDLLKKDMTVLLGDSGNSPYVIVRVLENSSVSSPQHVKGKIIDTNLYHDAIGSETYIGGCDGDWDGKIFLISEI